MSKIKIYQVLRDCGNCRIFFIKCVKFFKYMFRYFAIKLTVRRTKKRIKYSEYLFVFAMLKIGEFYNGNALKKAGNGTLL